MAKTSKANTLTYFTTRALGNKDSKIGPTLALKEMRREGKENKVPGPTHFEKIRHKSNCHESFGTEDHESGSTLTMKENTTKKGRVTKLVNIGNMTLL